MEKIWTKLLIAKSTASIINNEKIGIFGDYDVDGATSTAILGKYFTDH